MKIYLVPVDDEYELHATEYKTNFMSFFDKRVDNMGEGKVKSFLGKYLKKMESREESALKAAYHIEDLEIFYSDEVSEEEAKKKCRRLSQKYFKKNLLPLIIYGTLCPVTFVAAPFIPVLNWGVAFYFGYKFTSKYKGIKGYKKILNSNFKKGEMKDLESAIKAS